MASILRLYELAESDVFIQPIYIYIYSASYNIYIYIYIYVEVYRLYS